MNSKILGWVALIKSVNYLVLQGKINYLNKKFDQMVRSHVLFMLPHADGIIHYNTTNEIFFQLNNVRTIQHNTAQ